MRSRDGFTVLELLVVLLIAGVALGTTLPRIGRAMAQNRLQQAASVVAADLQLAHSMAARQRRPVRIEVVPADGVLRVRDVGAGTTIYSQRRLGRNSEYGLHAISASPTNVVTVYPTGIASGAIDITLNSAGRERVVRMSRAGQVRVGS